MLIMLILMLICTLTCLRVGQGVAVISFTIHVLLMQREHLQNKSCSHLFYVFLRIYRQSRTLNTTWGIFYNIQNTNLQSYLIFFSQTSRIYDQSYD